MNQLAKRIVDEATGEEPVTPPPPHKKVENLECMVALHFMHYNFA